MQAMGEKEFDTNVPDKEERKRVRQARIEARNATNDPQLNGKTKNEVEEETSRYKGQQQIADSLAHLDKKKSSGIDSVTMVRVEADWRESQRRISEEQQRQERLRALQEEAVRSGKQNASVEMRWSQLLQKTMPQELYESIHGQKQACADILASKDSLIREFNLQLKAKDEEYVRALKQQSEDVEEVLERMRAEFKDLQEEYEVELESVEDAFLSDRTKLLERNKEEIDALFDKRKTAELDFMDQKQKREEMYQKEVEDLIVHDQEEYNKLKIKLETDIQTLEQQLEEMQATYQLNTEKLEYNYRVLTERDNENSSTLQQLKRKQSKLKDTLSTMVQRYHETDTRDRKRNEELTEEYRRITKQYKDLQAKFRHFEVSDNKQFEELWGMHEEEVAKMVEKVLKADEIIQTQQLGWKWLPPDLSALYAASRTGSLAGGTNESKGLDGAEAGAPASVGEAAAGGDKEQPAASEDIPDEDPAARMVSGAKMKAMMQLLVSEAGFLVDTKVKEALDSFLPEESELAQAESLLRALGVEHENDVEALLSYFFPNPEDDEDNPLENPGGEDADAPQAFLELQRLISPDGVVKAISSFVASRKTSHGKRDVAAATAHAKTGDGEEEAPVAAVDSVNEEVEYWRRASSVVSEDTIRVWEQLEKALQDYNTILSQRSSCIDEVQDLRRQNASLKELLSTYLGARVNDELIVPPSQTIRLEDA